MPHMLHATYGGICYLAPYVAAMTSSSVLLAVEWAIDNIIFYTVRDRHDCGSHNEKCTLSQAGTDPLLPPVTRRQCPLRPETEKVLAELVEGRASGDPVFLSRLRKPFTRFGIYWLVGRCAAGVPTLKGRKITPHVLRHTTACHLVLAGVDINTIRAWLGHSSIDTTNIYAEIDLEMKAKAMAICDIVEPGPIRPWKENKGLMAFLNSL